MNFASIALPLLLASGVAAQAPPMPQPKPDDTAIIKDFNTRVTQYMSVHDQNSSAAPKPTDSAQQLHDQKKDMAARIQARRANAQQGDIFSPAIADYFRRQITATLKGPQGKRVQASLFGAEPVKNVPLKVNAAYPEGVPLQSTPPTLLLNLPRLPKQLEYRVVGRALVLHDIGPNLIVDFIPDGLPPRQEKH